MNGKCYYGTGRRKAQSLASSCGQGRGQITGQAAGPILRPQTGRMVVRQPLALTEHLESFDIMVNVTGGGKPANRRSAPRHHRALIDFSAELEAGTVRHQAW